MFDGNKFLRLAEELSEKSQEEYKRTAISRAYYSAFHNARNILEKKGLSYQSKESVHFAIWNTYNNLGRHYRKVSIIGDRLKVKRVTADYDKEINSINKLTENALREAHEINELLSKLG